MLRNLLISISVALTLVYFHSVAYFSKEWIIPALRGTVVEEATNRPISSAKVVLRGHAIDTVTNKGGEFFLPETYVNKSPLCIWFDPKNEMSEINIEIEHINYTPVIGKKLCLVSGVTLAKLAPVNLGTFKLKKVIK